MSRTLLSIRRYPVKTVAGEPLESAEVLSGGLAGDRVYAVHGDDGRWASGKNSANHRRVDPMFELAARTCPDGRVELDVDGARHDVDEPGLDALLTTRLGLDVHLRRAPDERFHDAEPVSIIGTASLDYCARTYDIDADPRRLRVNLVVETEEPFEEETWLERTVRIGSTELFVARRNTRCRMIDLAQDGASGRGKWLGPLANDRAAKLAVYARVTTPGTIAVGDAVEVA